MSRHAVAPWPLGPLARLALLALLLPITARAQTPAERMTRGLGAYRDLDFDSAAVLFRTALTVTGPNALAGADRERALVYLGATELFRERRDSAMAAFRRLILVNPRYRPDQLIFPPEVVGLFELVRQGTRAVVVNVPPVTQVNTGERLMVSVIAASYHPITAVVTRAGGGRVRTLYAGDIADSLLVLWDLRDSMGVAVDTGAYVVRVSSIANNRPVRAFEVPLDLRLVRSDTLPWPPPLSDSLLKPEVAPASSSARPLLAGAAAAVAAVVLPSLVASGSDASSARYAIAAAVSVGGIVGYVRGRRPVPVAANAASNQQMRAAWQRRLADVQAENVRRRTERHMTVRAGAGRVVESP